VSKTKLQFKYEENPSGGLGDIVRKPFGQSDYITTQEMMQEPRYGVSTKRTLLHVHILNMKQIHHVVTEI